MGFNFFKKSKKEDELLGINERNARLIYPNNQRKDYTLADDKLKTKEILIENRIACAKTYAIINYIGEIQQGWSQVQIYDAIAIKPANGSGGGGIKILKKDSDGNWKSGGKIIEEDVIFYHMANIIMGIYSLGSTDSVIIEECIIPHPFFHEIYPEGVPDFRIILLHQEPVLGMLRVPTDKSDGKANLHQGGLGIGIAMESGTLTHAYDGEHYHENHPDNGNMIFGKPIPQWNEIVDIAVQTSKHFPLQYLGVDIALDKTLGPLIMEVNVRPGLGIQLANKTGMKKILKEKGLYL